MNILRLKEVLKEKGVTGKELSEKIGITETSLSRIVKGDQQPRFDILLQIADALDVDVRVLFNSTKKDRTFAEKISSTIKELQEVKKSIEPVNIVDLLNYYNFKFEEKNSFNNGISPCYYHKNKNGYNVYFIFPNNVVDFGVYDLNKDLISLIIDIHSSLKEDHKEKFIVQSSTEV